MASDSYYTYERFANNLALYTGSVLMIGANNRNTPIFQSSIAELNSLAESQGVPAPITIVLSGFGMSKPAVHPENFVPYEPRAMSVSEMFSYLNMFHDDFGVGKVPCPDSLYDKHCPKGHTASKASHALQLAQKEYDLLKKTVAKDYSSLCSLGHNLVTLLGRYDALDKSYILKNPLDKDRIPGSSVVRSDKTDLSLDKIISSH